MIFSLSKKLCGLLKCFEMVDLFLVLFVGNHFCCMLPKWFLVDINFSMLWVFWPLTSHHRIDTQGIQHVNSS